MSDESDAEHDRMQAIADGDREEIEMGDDADAARDAWDALPWNERQRIEREIEDGEIDGEPYPFGARRVGQLDASDPWQGLREQLASRELRDWPPREQPPPVIRIDESESLPPTLRKLLAGLISDGRARPAFDEELAAAVIQDADDSRGGPHRSRRAQELSARRTQTARIGDLPAEFAQAAHRISMVGRKCSITPVFADQTGDDSMETTDMAELVNSLPPAVQMRLAALRPNEIGAVLDVLSTMADEPVSGRWPAEPPVGSVLRFEHSFTGVRPDSERYTYVALRTGVVDRPWFITSSRGRERMTWDALCQMIGDEAKAEVATGWFEIPAHTVPEQAEGDVDAFVALFAARGRDLEVKGE